ncbi:MAG: Lrp/AsnC family transcriptional regulator [Oscillospiraceae bacterium]|nr:Lrp/AsnC family transcriptional regulator [Oscillospiraceae bacterium]
MNKDILNLLESDAHLSAKEIAVMLGLEEADVAAEIAEMEKENIICGYKAVVNWEKTERQLVEALIELRVVPKPDFGFDEIAKKIMDFPEVTDVYLMSGGFDLAITVTGKSFQEIAYFVAGKISILESVVSTATHFVLKKYKNNNVIFEGESSDERRELGL